MGSHSLVRHRSPLLGALLAVVHAGCVPDVVPSRGPSCLGLADTCGPMGYESCCARSLPIAGGTYDRFDDPAYPASIGPFVLDRFEVTVGRYRRFVAGYPGDLPAAGAGAPPSVPAGGWTTSWNVNLPPDAPGLRAAMACDATYQTWTDAPGPNEDKPINCLTWYEAFAFCVWDGGRLPTQAEWSYAAVAAGAQRLYPWKNGPPDASRAVYGCTDTTTCMTFLQAVGATSPQGDGAFGQADLAGSLWEWTLDEYDPLMAACTDCADTSYPDAPSPNDGYRVRLGGSWRSAATALQMNESDRNNLAPYFAGNDLGARCARDE
jgi:sulfatase modifying factor 1